MTSLEVLKLLKTVLDVFITGADNENTLGQHIVLLSLGDFELRKWVSSYPRRVHNVPDAHLETPTFSEESQTPVFTVLC